MSAIGLYRPGTSVLHRTRAGRKLATLVLLSAVIVALPVWWAVLGVLAVLLASYAATFESPRVAARLAWSQARPLLVLVVVIVVFQTVVDGPARGAELGLTLVTLVLAAGLVTLTTRTSAMVDVIQRMARPLRRFGVDPERVGLSIALGIRAVPLVISLAQQVREAQLARGLGASPKAFAVPLIVRALRRSDALAEALVARGALDDEPEVSTSTRG